MKYLVLALFMSLARGVVHAAPPPAPFALTMEGLVVRDGLVRLEMKPEKTRSFDVVLTNVSGKPQPIFESWNSWGYYNVRFEVQARDGKPVTVGRGMQCWTMNGPSTEVVAAGARKVFEVSFDESWVMHPVVLAAGEYEVAFKAIFEAGASAEATKYGVWPGKVESPVYWVKLAVAPPAEKGQEPAKAEVKTRAKAHGVRKKAGGKKLASR